MRLLKTYFSVLIVAIALDNIWIGHLMSDAYTRQLAPLLRRLPDGGLDPVLWAALAVYLLLALGIVLFVQPRIATKRWLRDGLVWGAAFGFVSYGIYDMTNHALIRDWHLAISLIDAGWGSFLCAITGAVAGYWKS